MSEFSEVSEEQEVETVFFAGSEKLFGIGKVVDNSQFRLLQKLLRFTSCQAVCGEFKGKIRERRKSF